MSLISLSPLRLYLGLIVADATLLLYRPTISHVWTTDTTLFASLTDILVLLFLAAMYFFGLKLLHGRARKYNDYFHFTIALLALAIMISSQALFIKTGEYLDIHIISFFLLNINDLTPAVGSELDYDVLLVCVQALVIIFLASLRLKTGLVEYGRRITLVIPLLLLGLSEIYLDEVAPQALEHVKLSKSLYQGNYSDFNRRQVNWVRVFTDHWQQGLLSGVFFGTAFGKIEFNTISDMVGYYDFYRSPDYVGYTGKRPNIVLLILESFRSDIVGMYTNTSTEESYTPYIDYLAKNGVMVEEVYTTVPHTSKALVGIYCGMFPEFNPDISEARKGGIPFKCLPHLLNKAGYNTAHFQTAPASFENRVGLLKNTEFGHIVTQEDITDRAWQKLAYLGMDDRAMEMPAINWMLEQKSSDTPFFASLLTVVTHHPYASPGNIVPIHSEQDAYRAYIAGVRYTDEVIGELMQKMKDHGLLDNTIFVLVGDHGEAFGEHGQVMHNGVAYEEGIRVPLIVYSKDIKYGQRTVKGLWQHIDILPTLLSVAGVEYKGKLPGKNFLSGGKGHESIMTSCLYTDYCMTFRDSDGIKMAYFFGRRPCEVYDLKNDPKEKNVLDACDGNSAISDVMLSGLAKLRNSYQHAFRREEQLVLK